MQLNYYKRICKRYNLSFESTNKYFFVATAPIIGEVSQFRSTILCLAVFAPSSGFSYKNTCLVCSIIAIYEPSIKEQKYVH